jgi:hypothetical protein
MKVLFRYIVFLILVPFSVYAGQDLPIGVRPQGMGGAFAALANDANAVYWNPAGLGLVTAGEVNFMHWTFAEISEITVDHVSLAYPLQRGAMGFAATRQGAKLEQGPTNDSHTMSEYNLLVAFGLAISTRISVGMSLRRDIIDSYVGNGAGVGFNFGWLWKPLNNANWSIAVTANNVAADVKNEFLRPYYAGGTAYIYTSADKVHNLSFAFDVKSKQNIDGKEGITMQYGGGMEYLLQLDDYAFALRTGTGSNAHSFGFGLGLKSVRFDYAFVLLRENTIGNSHKVGISIKFGHKNVSNASS